MSSTSAAEWPDWTAWTAVIVGTGPSAAAVDLEEARGARVIAVKSAWRLAPWADALYACDKTWWVRNRGEPDFAGLKISASPVACSLYQDIRQVRLVSRAEILTKEIGVIGCGLRSGGGHSGFQAINLAVQFGARRIVLVGFDMTLARGAHWRPDASDAPADAGRVERWRAALDACEPQFRSLGVEVINASPGSALTAYRFATLRDAVGRS